MVILGIHHDGEDGERATGAENSTDGVGEQQFADAATARPLVAGEPTDQGRWNRIIARQLAGDLYRQIVNRKGEGTQAVESDNAVHIVNRDKDARDVALLILTCTAPEPFVEIGLSA